MKYPDLIYMRARYYDPSMGRFVSEDRAKNGKNWYIYCNDNPVNLVDPDGQMGEEIPGFSLPMKIIAGIVIVAMIAYYCFYIAEDVEEHSHGDHAPREPEPLERSWPPEEVNIESVEAIINTYKTGGNQLQQIAAAIVEIGYFLKMAEVL